MYITCGILLRAQQTTLLRLFACRLDHHRLSLWLEILRDALLWLRWRRDLQRHETVHQLLLVLDNDEDASKKPARRQHSRVWLSLDSRVYALIGVNTLSKSYQKAR